MQLQLQEYVRVESLNVAKSTQRSSVSQMGLAISNPLWQKTPRIYTDKVLYPRNYYHPARKGDLICLLPGAVERGGQRRYLARKHSTLYRLNI